MKQIHQQSSHYHHQRYNHNPLNQPSAIKTYYEMTVMSKRSLISESVMTIQISVHVTGEEPNNTSYAWSLRSHVRQPSVKSLLGQNQSPALRVNLGSQRSSGTAIILGYLILHP
jgi:hypothetical protein